MTRYGAAGAKRIDKYNPARAPYSPSSTLFSFKQGIDSDLLSAKQCGPGGYAGCSKRLYDIMKNGSAALYVYNTAFGAKPEVADKILRVLRGPKFAAAIRTMRAERTGATQTHATKTRAVKPKTCGASKIVNPASGRCVMSMGRVGKRLV